MGVQSGPRAGRLHPELPARGRCPEQGPLAAGKPGRTRWLIWGSPGQMSRLLVTQHTPGFLLQLLAVIVIITVRELMWVDPRATAPLRSHPPREGHGVQRGPGGAPPEPHGREGRAGDPTRAAHPHGPAGDHLSRSDCRRCAVCMRPQQQPCTLGRRRVHLQARHRRQVTARAPHAAGGPAAQASLCGREAGTGCPLQPPGPQVQVRAW